MIAKPHDWDTAQAYTGEKKTLTPGGHIVRIIGMRQEMSRNQKPMIVVGFDIDEGGEFDGYYAAQLKAKKAYNPSAKHQGVIRFMLYANDGQNTNGYFKAFITSVEESNSGYKWNWDERTMAGKMVGIVFGEEEYKGTDGKVYTSVKAQSARGVQAIRDGVKVPEKKKLLQSNANGSEMSGFTQVDDDELPF